MTFRTSSDNDLFSFLGWSTIIDGQMSSTCSQTVPDDVQRADNASSCAGSEICWDDILDQTTADMGFDLECLDGLDDMLLLSPVDAFAAVCWEEAIQLPPHSIVTKSSIPFPRRRPPPLSIVPETSSEESGYDSDLDELRTLKDEVESPLPSPFPSPLPSPYDTGFHLSHQPTVEPITFIKYSCLPYEINSSFILFEPQHTINYYSEDNIGLFPVPAEQRKATKVNRIAAFCANLPTRLLRSAP